MEFDDDEDDDLFLAAVEQAESNFSKPLAPVQKQKTLLDMFTVHKPPPPKLDDDSPTWTYPINIPLREYQYNIVQKALFHNTLVALRLGKTFIAAVVILNYFNWFPNGKIVFTATRPLVTQQIEACIKTAGIPPEHVQELTGHTAPDARRQLWKTKRIFFLTPQVMQNDINHNVCPTKDIVLVVVDEAHRATGNHAYAEIVRLLSEANAVFRILALTATPGSEVKTVQVIIDKLLIEKIEMRTEDSPDIKKYSHERGIEEIVVAPSELMNRISQLFVPLLQFYITKLNQSKAFYEKDPRNVSRFQLIQARDKWRSTKGNFAPAHAGSIESDFALSMTLCNAYQLLLQHGVVSFYQTLSEFINECSGPNAKVSNSKANLIRHPALVNCMQLIQHEMKSPLFSSHPKMEHLVHVLLQYFSEQENCHSRAIIFSQYRDSVDEIVKALQPHSPMIRVMSFVGQSSTKRKGFSQKEQLAVISQFQTGNYNVLVSTSIGEEGLDIGEVKLIVCYDTQSSPIRLLQRMGRAGRKGQGRIVLLLSQGKEEESFKKAQNQYRNIQRAVMEGRRFKMYQGPCCHVLPRHFRPVCVQKVVAIANNVKSILSAKSTEPKNNDLKKSEPKIKSFANVQGLSDIIASYVPVKVKWDAHPHEQGQELPLEIIPKSRRGQIMLDLFNRLDELLDVELSTFSQVLEAPAPIVLPLKSTIPIDPLWVPTDYTRVPLKEAPIQCFQPPAKVITLSSSPTNIKSSPLPAFNLPSSPLPPLDVKKPATPKTFDIPSTPELSPIPADILDKLDDIPELSSPVPLASKPLTRTFDVPSTPILKRQKAPILCITSTPDTGPILKRKHPMRMIESDDRSILSSIPSSDHVKRAKMYLDLEAELSSDVPVSSDEADEQGNLEGFVVDDSWHSQDFQVYRHRLTPKEDYEAIAKQFKCQYADTQSTMGSQDSLRDFIVDDDE